MIALLFNTHNYPGHLNTIQYPAYVQYALLMIPFKGEGLIGSLADRE